MFFTVLNRRKRDILTQHGASLTFLPSEDVSAWPENLRMKMERGEVARDDERGRCRRENLSITKL